MNKKGIEDVVVLILAAVVLIAFLGLGGYFTGFFGDYGKIGTCQASIIKASILQSGTGGLASAGLELLNQRISFLKCNGLPTTKIDLNSAVSNGQVNDNAVKKTIADSMLRCWNMVGKGQVDPYKYYEGNTVNCLVCSDVTFDKNFVDRVGGVYQIKDINYWLATNTVPGYQQTYFEALYGVKPDTAQVNSFKGQEYPLDLTKDYTIVWRMDADKQTLKGKLSAVGLGYVSGAVIGGKIGLVTGGPVFAFGGSVAGAAIGMIGSYWLTDKLDPKQIISTGIFLVPKDLLGEKFTLSKEGSAPIEKDFCTKVVNY